MVNGTAQEFPCPEPIEVLVRIGGGEVDVTAHEAATATVDVSPYDDTEASRTAAAETRVSFAGGRLHVESPELSTGWLRRGPRLRVRILLPNDSTVRVRTGSADVQLDGRFETVEVHTGSGDTVVDKVTGDLTVDSGSGDLRVNQVGGTLRFKSGSGDLRSGRVGGPVSVNTSSGDVTIDGVTSTVQVRSASGDVRLGSVGGNQATVTTASGDVSVGVPAGTSVWLDLSTASGSTRSDLAMSGEAPAGGAQLGLSVRTASGDIDVHRVLAVAA